MQFVFIACILVYRYIIVQKEKCAESEHNSCLSLNSQGKIFHFFLNFVIKLYKDIPFTLIASV